jgi:hemerythrin-like domain-containing protein
MEYEIDHALELVADIEQHYGQMAVGIYVSRLEECITELIQEVDFIDSAFEHAREIRRDIFRLQRAIRNITDPDSESKQIFYVGHALGRIESNLEQLQEHIRSDKQTYYPYIEDDVARIKTNVTEINQTIVEPEDIEAFANGIRWPDSAQQDVIAEAREMGDSDE